MTERRITGALLTAADHDAAYWLLREANNPPTGPQARAAFRARWLPWLLGRAPGPIMPRASDWASVH